MSADTSIWGTARPRYSAFISGISATRLGGCGAFIILAKMIPSHQNSYTGAKPVGRESWFPCHCDWDVLPNSQVHPSIHFTNKHIQSTLNKIKVLYCFTTTWNEIVYLYHEILFSYHKIMFKKAM